MVQRVKSFQNLLQKRAVPPLPDFISRLNTFKNVNCLTVTYAHSAISCFFFFFLIGVGYEPPTMEDEILIFFQPY